VVPPNACMIEVTLHFIVLNEMSSLLMIVNECCGDAVGLASDLQLRCCGFLLLSGHSCIMTLGKLFTPFMFLFPTQAV